jgi:hypothetical protein
MKKTLLALTMIGASAVVVAQENQTQVVDDGRIAAKDMHTLATDAALPVLQSYVPENILSNAKNTYGERLYSIKGVKSGNGEDVYQITLVDNQQSSVAWMGATGAEVAYVYRTDDMNTMATGTNTNSATNTATEPAPASTEPVTDETPAPANTLDEQPQEPKQDVEPIDDSTRNEMNNSISEPDTTVETAAPETTTTPEATKPEDEELQ